MQTESLISLYESLTMQTETLISLYESFTGSRPEQVEELPGAGSNRRYFRMKGPQTLIGVIGTSNEENHAFLTIDRHFKEKGLPVPEVYAATEDESCYLQEDLGEISSSSRPSKRDG